MAIESNPISAQSPATVSSGQQTHRNPGGASRSYLPQRSIMPISDLRNKSLRFLAPTICSQLCKHVVTHWKHKQPWQIAAIVVGAPGVRVFTTSRVASCS